MSWMDHRRANLSVQAILQVLAEEGLDTSSCLAGSGLTPADVLNADTIISDETEIAILERALEQLPKRAGYGIRAGKALRVTTFGIWGLAILASPKFRDAFDTITRFSKLSFLLSKIRLEERGGSATILVDVHELPASIQRYLFERYYAASVTFLREMLPDLDLSQFELHLPFEDAEYERELSKITGRTVVPGQANFALVTGTEWLDQPLPKADPIVHAHFLQQCQSLLNQRQELPDHAQLIRDHMIEGNRFSPRIEDVAAKAGLSSRSLKRRLKEDGTSFTEIVLSTKMTIAKELLSTAGLSVSITAHRLGYSETASFSRAYSRWWGHNPGQASKQQDTTPQ